MSDDDEPHSSDIRNAISALYAGAALLWVCIVVAACYFDGSITCAIPGAIFALPLFLFWYNSPELRRSDEHEMIEFGALAISIIAAMSLLGYISKNFGRTHPVIFYLVYAALFIIFMSVPDYYFGHRWLPLTVHIRAVLQIYAVAHLALAVVIVFRNGAGAAKDDP